MIYELAAAVVNDLLLYACDQKKQLENVRVRQEEKRWITNRKNKCAKPLLLFSLGDKLTITILNRIENKEMTMRNRHC
jgi:hypothetical protein